MYNCWKDVLRRFGPTVASSWRQYVVEAQGRLGGEWLRQGAGAHRAAAHPRRLGRHRVAHRNAGANEEVELMAADFQDAFHTLPGAEAEKEVPVQTTRTYDGHFLGFDPVAPKV